jgi:ribosomal protein S13
LLESTFRARKRIEIGLTFIYGIGRKRSGRHPDSGRA